MWQHVAPEIRRRRIAMQQHDGVALSHLRIRHLPAEDPPPLLLIWKCRRDHVASSCDELVQGRDRALSQKRTCDSRIVGAAGYGGSVQFPPAPQAGSASSSRSLACTFADAKRERECHDY